MCRYIHNDVQELADVYEEELEQRGVKLIWHAEAQRLWQPSEIGKLNTPDGIEVCSIMLYCTALYYTLLNHTILYIALEACSRSISRQGTHVNVLLVTALL
jgi:hypothetical protein